MTGPIVVIDTSAIEDWDSFHDVFAMAFGFPGFYGRNMDAWIDCLSYLDEPDAAMTSVHNTDDSVVVIQLEEAKGFSERCPEQFSALIECSSFVNWRRIEQGSGPVLALSFCM